MGGKSTSTQTESSQTAPWAAAQPALNGLLSSLQGQIGNANLTGAETGALNTLATNAGNSARYAPQIDDLAKGLLNGGGATAQAGNAQSAFDAYKGVLDPFASGTYAGAGGNPALKGYLDTIGNDVTNRVNGMFAGSGRFGSGSNVQSLARGIAEGTAPVLAAQYNTDVNRQIDAASSIYGAANSTIGLLNGMNQQGLANRQAGVDVGAQALNAENMPANQMLAIEAQRRGIPIEALGLLTQIGVPIAGLGSKSSGTRTGTQQMSGADQFMRIAQGIGALMPKGNISF